MPKEPPAILGKAGKRKRGGSMRAKSKMRETQTPAPLNPEEGWDDETPAEGIVLDFLTQEPVRRRVVQTAKMFEPKSAANSNWFFQKIFGEGDFIAAGEMVIPPEGKKPSKSVTFRCSMSSRAQCPSSSMKQRMSSPQAVCFSFPEETLTTSTTLVSET